MAEKIVSTEYVEGVSSETRQIPSYVVNAANEDVVNAAQQSETTKYSAFSKHMLRLYLVLIIPYLCGCLNGYDGSLMGGLNGLQSYRDYFHMYANPRPCEDVHLPCFQEDSRLLDRNCFRHLQYRIDPRRLLHRSSE